MYYSLDPCPYQFLSNTDLCLANWKLCSGGDYMYYYLWAKLYLDPLEIILFSDHGHWWSSPTKITGSRFQLNATRALKSERMFTFQ